jgi:hypothetical protein
MNAWAALRAEYEAALTAERAHDVTRITPEIEALPCGPKRTAALAALGSDFWDEGERLQDARCAIEDPLMDTPSPDAAAFAFKFLVAFGRGRDGGPWAEMLEEEAKRFAFGSDPHRAWLDERDVALVRCNSDEPGQDLSDEALDRLYRAFADIEERILATPAATLDGALVKLLVLGQLAGQHHHVDHELAWPVVEEAATLLGSKPLSQMGVGLLQDEGVEAAHG